LFLDVQRFGPFTQGRFELRTRREIGSSLGEFEGAAHAIQCDAAAMIFRPRTSAARSCGKELRLACNGGIAGD